MAFLAWDTTQRENPEHILLPLLSLPGNSIHTYLFMWSPSLEAFPEAVKLQPWLSA